MLLDTPNDAINGGEPAKSFFFTISFDLLFANINVDQFSNNAQQSVSARQLL